MTQDIIDFCHYFMATADDKDELRKLIETAGKKEKWVKAKAYFEQTRSKALKIQNKNNNLTELYSFIEACYKSLYNFTYSSAPFDSDSPYKVIKYAIKYCRVAGLKDTEIINIIG